jgi:glycosyltransferase involved in cell wall biosynthesis
MQITTSNPLISILMTCYNREEFIKESIESLLNSTYKNFELIISDDASTDNTVQIAQVFQQKDNRISIYVNEKNQGDYFNRNKAASLAKGKYIKYLDSDDKISMDGLQKMVDAMEAFPEAGLGIAQYYTEENKMDIYPSCITPEQAYLEHYGGLGILRYGPTGTIIRRDIFESLNCFGTTRFLGDTEFWLKLAAKYPIVKIEPGVVFWRLHKGQEYEIGQKSYTYLRYSYKIYVKSLMSPDCPLKSEDIKRIISRLKWKHARDILNLAFKKKKPLIAMKIFLEADFGFANLVRGLIPYKRLKNNF